MEPRAGYIAVGVFLIALGLGAAGFLAWLIGAGDGQTQTRYTVLFDGAVQGLSVGSPVQVQGIPVGTVATIRFADGAPGTVVVEAMVDAAAPIQQGSVAQLAMMGLTGGVMLQITGGDAGADPLPVDPRFDTPVIPSAPSAVQTLVDSLPDIMASTTELLTTFNALLDDESQRALTETLINVRTITEALAAETGDIDRLVGDVNGLVVNMDGLVSEVRVDLARLSDNLDSVLTTANAETASAAREIGSAAQSFRDLAENYGEAGESLATILREGRQPLQDFLGTGLYETTQTLIELRRLAEDIRTLLTQVERDPAVLLFGNAGEGVPAD